MTAQALAGTFVRWSGKEAGICSTLGPHSSAPRAKLSHTESGSPYTNERMKLSVIMPVYNERATLRQIVHRVLEVAPMELELICVDDGSRDNSREILAELQAQHPQQLRVVLQPHNMGKGAALRRGIQEATGDYVVIQDADLEYDPAEYPLLLEPLMDGKADVVYGSRFLGGRPHRVLYFWHSVGNWALTLPPTGAAWQSASADARPPPDGSASPASRSASPPAPRRPASSRTRGAAPPRLD